MKPPELGNHKYRRLTPRELNHLRDFVVKHLAENESITNRQLRKLTKITSDQAIIFFNNEVEGKILVRVRKYGGTRYRLT